MLFPFRENNMNEADRVSFDNGQLEFVMLNSFTLHLSMNKTVMSILQWCVKHMMMNVWEPNTFHVFSWKDVMGMIHKST